MEETNVNKLNGVPNYGHGLPGDGVVQAGITDYPQALKESNMSENEETNEGQENVPEDVTENEVAEETDNG